MREPQSRCYRDHCGHCQDLCGCVCIRSIVSVYRQPQQYLNLSSPSSTSTSPPTARADVIRSIVMSRCEVSDPHAFSCVGRFFLVALGTCS